MGIEDEFNRSQALALDAENKALMAEIERLRAALYEAAQMVIDIAPQQGEMRDDATKFIQTAIDIEALGNEADNYRRAAWT